MHNLTHSAMRVFATLFVAGLAATVWAQDCKIDDEIHCSVLIVGGSGAALASAIAVADLQAASFTSQNGAGSAGQLRVCLTEPTEWVGGQLTSSGVSAPDYGLCNRLDKNQPTSWRSLSAHLGAPQSARCWVSTQCSTPDHIAAWTQQQVASRNGTLVFLPRTVPTWVERDPASGAVEAVTVIQSVPRSAGIDTRDRVSRLLDAYSCSPSSAATKRVLRLVAPVVVEATELGEVLALGDLPYHLGAETPSEDSAQSLPQCVQAFTYPAFATLKRAQREGDQRVQLQDESDDFSLNNFTWTKVWTYRRGATGSASPNVNTAAVGDVTQLNWGAHGNDLDTAPLLLPPSHPQARRPAAPGQWTGGMNVSVLAQGAARSLRFLSWFGAQAPSGMLATAATDAAGTSDGVAMLLYLRDSRRSVGIGGYQLTRAEAQAGSGHVADRMWDAVAMADYPQDTHLINKSVCTMPAYITPGVKNKPFFVSLRALTNDGAPNVLVAGKVMAQSFWINSATRVHLGEWSSGLAAGAAAWLMASQGISSTTTLLKEKVAEVQALVQGSVIGQPLEWSVGQWPCVF